MLSIRASRLSPVRESGLSVSAAGGKVGIGGAGLATAGLGMAGFGMAGVMSVVLG